MHLIIIKDIEIYFAGVEVSDLMGLKLNNVVKLWYANLRCVITSDVIVQDIDRREDAVVIFNYLQHFAGFMHINDETLMHFALIS